MIPGDPPRPAPAQPAVPWGLCASCRHARHLTTARSAFLRCNLADQDPGFSRYPRLPVLACAGFAPRIESQPPPPAEA